MIDFEKVRVVASSSVVMCELDSGMALLDLQRNMYFSLNPTGAVIWQAIKKPSSLGEMCAAVAQRFVTTADACRSDVALLTEQLVDSQLARVVDATSD